MLLVSFTGSNTLCFKFSFNHLVISIRQSAPSFTAFSIGPDKYAIIVEFVEFSEKMQEFDTQIKFFLKINMYKHKLVLNKAKYGMKILKTLFNKVIKNPKKYIKNKFFYNFSKERMVCDFIAGMTDRYAINLYNSIK